MMVAVLVRDEDSVNIVEAQSGASVEFGRHRFFIFEGRIDNDAETVA